MDPSSRESSSTGHQLGDSSGNASPSDTRHPLAQAESAVLREAEGLSESFQSTDTVRRRPEGYGRFYAFSWRETGANFKYS
jgi:Ca2+:H+ antiporter